MFKSFIYKIIESQHFWRYASFNEIAEIYMSRTVRTIALSLVSGFTSVYMYEAGYSLPFIMGVFLVYYLLKIPMAFLAGRIIARYGPKHGILISNILHAPAMFALGFMPIFGVYSIAIWIILLAISSSIYQISYMVDFSKVKNTEHAGKELAVMNILEKVAIGLSPIIGGLIALIAGLQLVIWISVVMFIVSSLPLLRSIEPTRLRQKIKFEGFPWATNLRGIIANTGIGFDYVTTGIAWHLFIIIAIFPGAGWEIYVKLGALSSVTILTAVVASYAYGKLIDNSKGGNLLKFSVIANALVHIFRPFSAVPAAIVGTNIANELATVGYNMAFTRGEFDSADLSGHRILYLCICDAVANFGAALAAVTLMTLAIYMGNSSGLSVFFFVAAGFVLIIGTAKFDIYRK